LQAEPLFEQFFEAEGTTAPAGFLRGLRFLLVVSNDCSNNAAGSPDCRLARFERKQIQSVVLDVARGVLASTRGPTTLDPGHDSQE